MKTTSSSLISLCGCLLLGLTTCGGGGGGGDAQPNDVPDYSVTIQPASASVRVEETQQFTATVSAPTNKGVTWSVYGTGNCVGDACGTITSGGLYTAPSIVPNPAMVKVAATSKDNANSSASVTVTILAGLTVSISPLSANIAVNGTQQFTALVQNSTNTAVTWSVSGSGCTGASCGTITSAGLYTAPSAVPDPATVSVTATSQANASKFATATVTIGGSSLGKLNGHFAFLLSGFDANGPMHSAGVFVADGNGNLTNGVLDINRVSAVGAQIAFSGTYTLGADRRGELVMTSLLGTFRYRFALNEDATEARLVQMDDTGTRSSGVFISQNPVSFSTSTVQGDYVLSLSGGNLGGDRVAAVGKFHADGLGNFTNGRWDLNDSSVNPPAMANWTGSYAVDSVGRGTAVLTIAGMGALNFSFYVGYTNHNVISEPAALFFVSMDALSASTPMLSGPIAQAYPMTYGDDSWPVNGFLRVFTLAGTAPGVGTTGIMGTFEADGAGNLQNGLFDQNRAGVISSSSNFSGTYSIEPSGRGTGTMQLSSTQTMPITFYLATPDRAVLLGTPGTDVLLGSLWSMGGGGAPGDPTMFSGDYIIGPYAFTSPDMAMFSGVLNSDGAGTFSGTQDINTPVDSFVGELIAGTYGFGIRGRGTANLDGGVIVLYVVSLDAELAMSINSGDAIPTVYVVKR